MSDLEERAFVPPARYAQTTVVPLTPGARYKRREAVVVRTAGGELRAFVNRCRHLPVPLDAGTGRFLSEDGGQLECLTHGAAYALEDGSCVDGPCGGRGLVALPIVERGGTWIILDDGRDI